MEALILSCSTGGGHHSAGRAIQKKLDASGWKTTFLDPYTLRSQKMADSVGGAYVGLVRFSPALFGGVYQIGRLYDKGERAFGLPNPVMLVQKKTALALYDYLQQQPADLIICSHPYPGLMITWLKKHHYKMPPSIMIATDYTCIPFEEDVQTDWMVIPHPDLKEEFHQHGVDYSRMICSGIPIDPKLGIFTSRSRAAKSLNLDPDNRYILIGGGSMGVAGIWPVLRELRPLLDRYPDLKILVLCGSNQKIFNKIRKMKQPDIIPVSFTTRMYEYLNLASLYITKPGGLSITEAAACGVPMILTQAIPGCETVNERFFEERGWARRVSSEKEIPKLVDELLEQEVRSRRKPNDLFRHSTETLARWCECAAGLNSPRMERQWNSVRLRSADQIS